MYGSWTLNTFNISAYANEALRVRFGFDVMSGGALTSSGWNVDDVEIGC